MSGCLGQARWLRFRSLEAFGFSCLKATIRILHYWATQVSKFEKAPSFAESDDLRIAFLEGVKCMIPRENGKWVIEKFTADAENRMKLITTDMTGSKTYKVAAEKAKAEQAGEAYEPPAPKKAKTDEIVVHETLSLTVDMGPKKNARNVQWLDDVARMIHAAQSAVVDNSQSEECVNNVKDPSSQLASLLSEDCRVVRPVGSGLWIADRGHLGIVGLCFVCVVCRVFMCFCVCGGVGGD